VLPSGQKLTLSLLAIIALEVVPFRAYAPFPARLPFLNASLEVVFCEGVQHRLQFCLDHLIYIKMAALHFHLQSVKQKSKMSMGRQSCCFLVKKIPGVEMVRFRDATATSFVAKVRGEVFAHFHAVAIKRHSSMWN
jgi:hypothetical protein